MSDKELSDAINGLFREIDSLDENDPADREQLRALADTLKARLARYSEVDESSSVVDRTVADPVDDSDDDLGDNAVLDMIATYEAQHPKLTAMLNDIMTRLASMGI